MRVRLADTDTNLSGQPYLFQLPERLPIISTHRYYRRQQRLGLEGLSKMNSLTNLSERFDIRGRCPTAFAVDRQNWGPSKCILPSNWDQSPSAATCSCGRSVS